MKLFTEIVGKRAYFKQVLMRKKIAAILKRKSFSGGDFIFDVVKMFHLKFQGGGTRFCASVSHVIDESSSSTIAALISFELSPSFCASRKALRAFL